MAEFTHLIKDRLKELEKLMKSKKYVEKQVEKGRIKINKKGSTVRYYYYDDTIRNKGGKYLHKSEKQLASNLIQYSYDKQVYNSAKQEHKALSRLLHSLPKVTAEHIYSSLYPERQKLVTPITLPDDQFIASWKQEHPNTSDFHQINSEFYTGNGEHVRSKSEMIIADMLREYGVTYVYETTLNLEKYGTVHPDFRALDITTREDVIWEHFGKMDDPDYQREALRKINAYIANGYIPGENLIMTFESGECPLNTQVVRQLIVSRFS